MPDNRRIVFGGALPGTLGRDLQVADTRSRTIRPLTVTTQDAVLPAVSPDGGKIAFTLANNDFNLIEIPLDGSAVWDLLNTSRDEVDPTFSPVADEYAYTTNRTGREQIWLRSRRGDWERPVVTEKDFSEAWILSLRETSFAPDGQRIAYAAVGSRGHAVYISNAKGGTPLRLTAGKEPYERSPSWNPAGNWIAYLQNNDGRWALAKAPTGGGEQPVILREGCLRSHPKWSKRGDWITCQTPDGLTLVSPDGKTSKVISKEDWVVYGWSADGGTLYGIKRAANGASVLASIAVDSGAGKTIADLKLPAHAELAGYSLDRGALSFATSVNRPRADIWTLEGFGPPAGWRRWLAFR